MKIALITDTHFGARNDNLFFNDYFYKFWDNVFFPYVKENNMIYYNCSAKSDINVHEGFSKLAHKIKKNVE